MLTFQFYSSNNINQTPENRIKDKDIKKKKKVKTEVAPNEVKKEIQWPPAPVFETPKEDNNDGGFYCYSFSLLSVAN